MITNVDSDALIGGVIVVLGVALVGSIMAEVAVVMVTSPGTYAYILLGLSTAKEFFTSKVAGGLVRVAAYGGCLYLLVTTSAWVTVVAVVTVAALDLWLMDDDAHRFHTVALAVWLIPLADVFEVYGSYATFMEDPPRKLFGEGDGFLNLGPVGVERIATAMRWLFSFGAAAVVSEVNADHDGKHRTRRDLQPRNGDDRTLAAGTTFAIAFVAGWVGLATH
ncbi:MAG: hypothetical protein AAGA37_13700 [Actinomycetota bacterium]